MASHLSEKVKYQIMLRGMTIAEFAIKHNISRAHVDNILYDRSKNPEIISQIARALEIPLEYFLHEKDNRATEFSKERELDKFKNLKKFDIILFKETVNIIADIYLEKDLDVSQKRFYNDIEEIYHYASQNEYNISQLRSFAGVFINYAIKQNKIKKKTT